MPKKYVQLDGVKSPVELVELTKGYLVDRATAEACWELNRGGRIMLSHSSVERPNREHPDVRVVEAWLAKQSLREDELEIIFRLCYAVRSEWIMLPKRTKSEHRKFFLRIESLCHELETALDESGPGAGWGFGHVRVFDLFSEKEKSTFPESEEPRVGSGRNIQGHFPFVGDMLKRLGEEASKFATHGPAHTQPNKKGAERGYFVRRIANIFCLRYGQSPHEVIAALTTISLGDATDRELVGKLLR